MTTTAKHTGVPNLFDGSIYLYHTASDNHTLTGDDIYSTVES